MKTEQQKQAESLYYQTDLSKTEIANMVGVSRRTLHYWVQQNHWDAIKQNASIMPTMLAGNCYLIMAKFQESLLSPERAGIPATQQEVNTMYRLTATINKLTDRATLNESLEKMTRFMEFVGDRYPHLTTIFETVVNEFIMHRAAETSMLPAAARAITPAPVQNEAKDLLDLEDLTSSPATTGNNNTTPAATLPAPPPPASSATLTPSAKGTASPHTLPPTPMQNTTAPKPTQILKGKANNRAARRAAARAAA